MELKKWTLTLLACFAVAAALFWFKATEIRGAIAAAAAYPEQSETVEEALVEEQLYMPSITVLGEMVAPQRLDLRNEIAGEIVAVNVEPGARIEKGQVLVQLDTSVEEANLAAAQAREELAQLVFDRADNLFQSNVSSRDQLDRARAELAAVDAEIRALQRTIDKKTLRAPFDGRAGLHELEIGQYIPSNTLIANLIGDTDHIWVDFQVPQFYPRLETGSSVRTSQIGRGDEAMASIIAENTVLNASNRSRAYRARLEDAHGQYMANTMLQVDVPTGESRRLLRIPAVAVQNDPLGQYVFRLREDPEAGGFRAERQQVEVVLIEDGRALVETGQGLEPGDRIAGAGAFKLYPGILTHVGRRSEG